MSSGDKRKKTALRTIRVTKELDELLEKDAAKWMTVNGLLSSILSSERERSRGRGLEYRR